MVELTASEKRELVETLRTDYSVREISETLGFNRSLLYYHPKSDPSQEVLREEIEKLCRRYPKYGYRRIRHLLLRLGYTVGYRRVARLMKADNLSVAVKRTCQTTRSLEGIIDTLHLSMRSGLGWRYNDVRLQDASSMLRCSWMSSLALKGWHEPPFEHILTLKLMPAAPFSDTQQFLEHSE